MNISLFWALQVLIGLCLFVGSVALLVKARTLCTILQVLGSGSFFGAVLAQRSGGIDEMLTRLRWWTNWLAVIGLVTFSVAFLFGAFFKSDSKSC